MKHCLACGDSYETSLADDSECPKCGYICTKIDGFAAYAPELAREGGGFKEAYFTDLAALEAANFWFRARSELILWAARRYAPDMKSFLEIGCGTGFVLSSISRFFPDTAVVGSEIFVAGLGYAAGRVPKARCVQMDARRIPYYEEFDCIGAFDVIEHVEEDDIVLREIHGALKPGGILLITVPQHQWLWSAADEYACHQRRYTAAELADKLDAGGFDVLKSTSFVTLLLPLMMVSRLFGMQSIEEYDPVAELKIDRRLNEALYKVLSLERKFIEMGAEFRWGGSRLVVGKKK